MLRTMLFGRISILSTWQSNQALCWILEVVIFVLQNGQLLIILASRMISSPQSWKFVGVLVCWILQEEGYQRSCAVGGASFGCGAPSSSLKKLRRAMCFWQAFA